ncbi:hypothetical protein XspCFBP7912_06275 [Xanthomonas sp. CFBP 7912]|nr:hypothetical protein XspCFBP7912_06275 [Xanthomonas sp. CFBP 7912]RJS05716.1 hypothetical protein XnspCFBP7698_05930 [Xanthomonas sp. CFBP 7698]
MTALLEQTVIVPLGQRQVGMPGIVALGSGQQGGGIGKCVACQRMARLRQQIGQGIFASFQRVGAVRGQGQDALVKRQRAVGGSIQAPLLLGDHRLCEQGIESGTARLQVAQAQRSRGGLRLRHLQRTCQCQRALRTGRIAGRDGRTRLHHGGGTGTRQAGPRLGAIAVQRERSVEQFARPGAVGCAEPAAQQGRIAALQQLLDARIRPQPVGKRLAQHDDAEEQAGGQRQHHAPQRAAAQRRPEAGRPGPARQRKHAVASILGAT